MAGRSLTGNRKYAASPKRMTETVRAIVITGRRMNGSEKFMTGLHPDFYRCSLPSPDPPVWGPPEFAKQCVLSLPAAPATARQAPRVHWLQVPARPLHHFPAAVPTSLGATQPCHPLSPHRQKFPAG